MKNKTPKLISLKKLTDLKWVNLYKSVHTISNGKEVKYNFITRRDSKHMGKSHTKYVDSGRPQVETVTERALRFRPFSSVRRRMKASRLS